MLRLHTSFVLHTSIYLSWLQNKSYNRQVEHQWTSILFLSKNKYKILVLSQFAITNFCHFDWTQWALMHFEDQKYPITHIEYAHDKTYRPAASHCQLTNNTTSMLIHYFFKQESNWRCGKLQCHFPEVITSCLDSEMLITETKFLSYHCYPGMA